MSDLFGHDWSLYDFEARAVAEGWIVRHGGKPPAIRFTDLSGLGGGTWSLGAMPGLWALMDSLPKSVLYKSIPQTVEHQRHHDRSFVRLCRGYIHEARIIWDALTDSDMLLLRQLYQLSQVEAGLGTAQIHIKIHGEDEMYIRVLAQGDWAPDYPQGAWSEPKPWWHKYELQLRSQMAYTEPLYDFGEAPEYD
jgi:hypothetical protein